jgi:hypothetical protein
MNKRGEYKNESHVLTFFKGKTLIFLRHVIMFIISERSPLYIALTSCVISYKIYAWKTLYIL